jgi:hypothetical protein
MDERILLKYAQALNAARKRKGLQAIDTRDLQSRSNKILVFDKPATVQQQRDASWIHDEVKQQAELEKHALQIMKGLK